MRRPAPQTPPVALTVAGSDSGGGAGVQADLKTMEAHGVFGASVVTAVTAQNTRSVEGSHVLPVEEIESQYRAVVDDLDVRAAKTGMLATRAVIESVAELVAEFDGPVVVDPVMVATSGDRLLDEAAEDAYEALLAEAALVTPNVDEARVLTGIGIDGPEDARDAGEAILEMGADAALVKGGHLGGETVVDTLVTPSETTTFEHPRVETEATHGSGCALSSAIAARLALADEAATVDRGTREAGDERPDEPDLASAVDVATSFMARAVRYPLDVGGGPGTVHHLAGLREEADRWRTTETVERLVRAFVERDASALVPEVGMNVVGATRFAEAVGETAAVEGRITRTLSGISPNRGVRLGASSHVARFLLAAREIDPALRFAVNCRFNGDIEAALSDLDGPVAEFDRDAEPAGVKAEEGSTMGWGARRAFESTGSTDSTPIAVVDRGEVGKEAIVKLLAEDAEALRERTFALLDALES